MTNQERGEALAWTVDLAARAADLARSMVARGMTVDTKANGTLVTDVDTAVERLLRDAIRARYPDHAILGEEYGVEGALDAAQVPLWAIDPIDGTTNLANGLPLWAVSIALIEGDEPTVGVIHAPLIGEVYAAASGLGATFNGRPLSSLSDPGSTHWEDAYGVCSNSVRACDFSRLEARIRVPGSAALDLAWVAAGRLRGTQSIGTSLYDVAAGLCLCNEVGARTVWHASGLPYSPRAHAGTGPHEELLVTAPPRTLAFLRERVAAR